MMYHVTEGQGNKTSEYVVNSTSSAAAAANAIRCFAPGDAPFTVVVEKSQFGLLHTSETNALADVVVDLPEDEE